MDCNESNVIDTLLSKVFWWLWQKDDIHRILSGMEWWLATVWEHCVEWWGNVSCRWVRELAQLSLRDSRQPWPLCGKGSVCPKVTLWYGITTTVAGFFVSRDTLNVVRNVMRSCVASHLSKEKHRNTSLHAGCGKPSFCKLCLYIACMIISQDDGLGDVAFMNGLPTAQTWCTDFFLWGWVT
jgi:hypothetical protein